MQQAPETILLNYIQDSWSLNVEGVTKEDVMFTDKDVNTENGTYKPHVIVQPAGARRLQPAEDDLYEFTFVIKVTLWSRWHKIPQDTDKKQLHWLMIDHIKNMFSIQNNHCPNTWETAYVDSTANVALAMNLLPDINEYNLTVKATIAWT
jgi:hypothetical protein